MGPSTEIDLNLWWISSDHFPQFCSVSFSHTNSQTLRAPACTGGRVTRCFKLGLALQREGTLLGETGGDLVLCSKALWGILALPTDAIVEQCTGGRDMFYMYCTRP